MRITKHFRLFLFFVFLFGLNSIELNAQKMYGYSDGNIISFDVQNPGVVTNLGNISFLPADTELLAWDFRPNTGELFGLSGNRFTGHTFVVRINILTRSASRIGPGFNIQFGDGPVRMDFNPTVDRIRVVTATGRNYRINPITGTIAATDGNLAYSGSDVNSGVTPRIRAAAYTNSYIASTSTTLYNYDAALNVLVTQSPPNDGILNTVGPSNLSFDSTAIIDMDILSGPPGTPNRAYMVASADKLGSSQLYSMNLSTGEATLIGNVGYPTAIEMATFEIDRDVPFELTGHIIYALNSAGMVISFDSDNPTFIRSSNPVNGLPVGQTLVGIDFRPNTGELWGLGYDRSNGNSRLYTLNPGNGAVTPQGPGFFNLDLGTGAISFDFNPAVDRIRVIGANQMNYRLNPVTGGIAAEDGKINYAAGDVNEGKIPGVVAAAYTNSYPASASTGLYVYDAIANVFAFQNPPNDGILNTIGSSGLNVDPENSSVDMDIYFDLEDRTNKAIFVAEQSETSDKLYSVNLDNGQTTEIGYIGNGIAITKIAAYINREFSGGLLGKLVYGITQNNYLFSFDTERSETIRDLKLLSGMEAGQTVAGADFRPNTGELWVLGYNASSSKARLYTANLSSGALTPAGTAEFDLDLGDGSGIGFDFNPTVDRIRVVSANGKNFRLNPISGGLAATDGDLKYAAGDPNENKPPVITSAAYTNSYLGSTNTGLFVFDAAKGNIAFQNPPNDGILNTVGSAGLNINPAMLHTSMDAYHNSATGTNTFILAAKPDGSNFDDLYSVNVSTGAITRMGRLGTALSVRALSAVIERNVPAEVEGLLAYGLASNNNLVTFDTENPSVLRKSVPITGITAGEVWAGIDFRPATGELWGLGYNSANQTAHLYLIDTLSAVATLQGTAPINLELGNGAISFDFNPLVDRIRVIGENGKNFRLNPLTGGFVAEDGSIKYADGDVNEGETPAIGAAFYTNSFSGTTSTGLYVYDLEKNIIAFQNPPNDGILNTVGSSGISAARMPARIAMDASTNRFTGENKIFLSAVTEGNTFSNLYSLDLSSGLVSNIGRIGDGMALNKFSIAIDTNSTPPPADDLLYAITKSNRLIQFKADAPGTVTNIGEITGILPDQKLVGADFRPNTGELWALGYNSTDGASRLYTIDLISGDATPVGSSFFTLDLGDGQGVGFDFNPTVDRIRVVADNGKNYRLNPITGTLVTADGDLVYADSDPNAGEEPVVVAAGYTNSYIGSTQTSLFVFDKEKNTIAFQNPPNDGVLNTVGMSGIITEPTSRNASMDIFHDPRTGDNRAYFAATFFPGANSILHSVNLTSGSISSIGSIGGTEEVIAITAFIDRELPAQVTGRLAFALATNNTLLTFDTDRPEVIRKSVPLTGIEAGQIVAGIDFRPNTGELWALGYNTGTNQARLYVIDTLSGMATTRGMASFELILGSGAVAFDFNPTVDRIRVIGSNGNNYRLNPVTGGLAATDGNIAYAAGDPNAGNTPSISAAFYTNSYIATPSTGLYVYDVSNNVLALQSPPNDGILNTIGQTGITVNNMPATIDMDAWFDAETQTNEVYLVANTTGALNDNLYTINIASGAATLVGSIGQGIAVRKISIAIDRNVVVNPEGDLLFGITGNNQLVTFDANNPETIRTSVPMTGIPADKVIVGADFRPNNGELWALAYNASNGASRLLTIDLSTGVASERGTADLTLDLGNAREIGFDFNPTVDRIRVVASNGKNYRLNPVNGGLAATDGDLDFASGDINEDEVPQIGAAAYTNSYIGSTSTALYVLDIERSILAFQNPPNDGVLNTIGGSGLEINQDDRQASMDIYSDPETGQNRGYLSAKAGGSNTSNLYTVDVSSGAFTSLGRIGAGVSMRAISAQIQKTEPGNLMGKLAYALTSNGRIVTFDTENPELIRTEKGTTGIKAGERLVGIDFRPSKALLYGLGYNASAQTASIYTIDTLTGALTIVGTGDISMNLGNGIVGFDFNPVVDRIRVVSQNGNNYRLHPETGVLVATDGALAYAAGDPNNGATPNIVTGAYSQSFNTTSATTLFNIDASLNILATQVPPNDGVLNTIGGLGVTANPADPTAGFDINYDLEVRLDFGYVVLNAGTSNFDRLYTIDLSDGSLTETGRVGQGIALIDVAISIDSVFISSSREIIDNTIPISITPNPGNEYFTILFDDRTSGHIEITVFDLNGTLVLNSGRLLSDINGQATITTEGLPAGMYIVKVKNANQLVRTSKWIKTE
jgi:hypothetical protein